MWCVIWRKEDSLYQIFTNLIFDSEKNAVEFINKEKSMRKKHDCRAVKYDYKYFNGVTENEIDR